MKLGNTQIVLGLLSFVLVMGVLYVDLERTSPGPVSTTHAQEAVLVASEGCQKCHGEGRGRMPEACADCHEEIERDVARGSGLHGTFARTTGPGAIDPRDCGHCHHEHLGADYPLVSDRSFALAGIPDPRAFDHAALDFELAGRHLELACAECHANAEAPLLAKGSKRFLGLDQSCAACHEDVHEGRYVRACADCHGQAHPFAEVESFVHESFPSDGAHARAGCEKCHEESSAHAIEILAGPEPTVVERACLDCHDDSPHSRGFVAAASDLGDSRPAESCGLCHAAAHDAFGGHPEAMPDGLHAASGFPLDAPHDAADCASCHGASSDPREQRYPGRSPQLCEACHDDPHAGQFDDGPFQGCLACHAPHAFLPSAFGPSEHARTAFPLEGSHGAVACAGCHARSHPDEPRVFAGTAHDCAACHEDAHRGRLGGDGADAHDCGRCHATTLFAEVDRGDFDHDRWTAFALEGRHADAACEACHPAGREPDPLGRAFGFVHEVFDGPADDCATCHADVHRGLFDRPGLPERVGGEAGCERCHSTEGFRPAARELLDDERWHGRWTGYPIAGFHERVACEDCHPRSATPDADGRTLGRAATSCSDCHADPHVGQFGPRGQDCASCHLDDGGLAFDHQRDSRFPLDETHAKLECGACHRPWPLPGGGSAVRFKPLGTTCTDCHGPTGRPPSSSRPSRPSRPSRTGGAR